MRLDRQERIARLIVLASTAWFALAVGWGLFGPIGGGHWAIVGSRGIMADNMVSWGVLGPVREYTLARPTPQLYYVHHPWGTYWVIGALMKVLGRHPYVPRLEPWLMSVATPPLLYGIGRVLWGPIPGALCALAYVVLPIALAFGDFPGFEVPLIFGCLLATWGYLRFQQRWRRRWMAVSLAGVLWSINADWESAVFLGTVLGGLLVAGLFLPRWFGRVDARRFGQWWSLSFIIVVVTVFAYLAYIKNAGLLEDFFNQEAKREKGNDQPLWQVLEARRYWIEVSFTPVAIAVGKLAAPIFVIRVLLLRRTLEIFPLALLLMATVEYVHFKNGADVHTFWPLPFAPYWALSVGLLARLALDLTTFVATRFDARLPKDAIPLGVLGSIGFIPLLILPDGVRGLNYARITGGRLNDRGRRIFQDVDKSAATEWFAGRMTETSRVQVHATFHSTWAVDWALRRPVVNVDSGPARSTGEDRYFLADLAFMKPGDQVKMARDFKITAVGQFVMVDRAAPPAPADGFVFDVREPGPLEWLLVAGTDPIRTVRPDPFYTWELRDEFGQVPNPPPTAAPTTLEEIRIAHNVAIAAGDDAAAEALKAKLIAGLDAQPTTRFTDGTTLLGERLVRGVAPVLDLYFLAAGPATSDDTQFDIQSVVERAPLGSLVSADPKAKAAGMPLALPPKLWKAGYIYADHTEIRHRPGREVFTGFFTGGNDATRPRPVDAARNVDLLTLH
jgi:hypothetical protein